MNAAPRIVMFTRWPTAGMAKTRLIPAVGAERAAAIHRRLTERTLDAVRVAGFVPEVRFTGAAMEAFSNWLGADAHYVHQGDGDLGARLARAAEAAPVILIGSDAPDLSAAHLRDAVAALREHPAVIGPAEDGGYWLLGFRAPSPWAFDDVPWSTDRVFAITRDRFRERCIEPHSLVILADLDTPDDLGRWPDLVP